MSSIVGLPGLLCQPSVFDGIRAHPALTELRALRLPDLDSFSSIAQELSREIEPDTILVGMSMGSYLCLELMRLVPERITALVLVGTQAVADTPEAAEARAKSSRWAGKAGMETLADVVCDQMLGAAARRDQNVRNKVASMAVATGIETFARHQTALAGRPDATATLASIKCPVLVLTGEEDKVTPPAAGRGVANGVADGHFIALDGLGHLPMIEAPELVAGHVATFIASVTNRKAAA